MRDENLIFLFLDQNICCVYSEEPSHRDGTSEHPKQMFKPVDKKIFTPLRPKVLFIWTYVVWHKNFTNARLPPLTSTWDALDRERTRKSANKFHGNLISFDYEKLLRYFLTYEITLHSCGWHPLRSAERNDAYTSTKFMSSWYHRCVIII